VGLREPLKPARSEPASNVHAPLAVSDACLATFSLPFTPQLCHTAPPALPRSAASASYGQPGGWLPRPRRLAQRARRGSFGAGRGRRSGAAGDLLRELAVWTRLAELLGAVVAGAPPRRGGWELLFEMSRPGPAALLSLKGRVANSASDNGVLGTIAAAEAAYAARQAQVRLPHDLGYTTGLLGRLQSHRCAPPAFRCSQLEVPPRLGPTAALAPKTQSRLSRPGAGYGDFWRDRCGRAGSSGGGTSCRGSSATYFLVAHSDRGHPVIIRILRVFY
jgi:hypothetical protein